MTRGERRARKKARASAAHTEPAVLAGRQAGRDPEYTVKIDWDWPDPEYTVKIASDAAPENNCLQEQALATRSIEEATRKHPGKP